MFGADDLAALAAHARLAASGRKVVAGGADAQRQEPDYRRYARQCHSADCTEEMTGIERVPGSVSEYHRLPCPDCGSPCKIRTSEQMSKLTRAYKYQCTNVDCGGCYGATMEINRIISTSAIPDPKLNLPVSKNIKRDVIKAQMEFARTAQNEPYFHQQKKTDKPVTGSLFNRPLTE